MRFHLADRILEIEAGRLIRTAKNLTLAEEYLAEHFPTFPIMPGVLMLQSLVEASSWLLRVTEDFQKSIVVLRETKNVKFGNLVEPGQTLLVTSELLDQSHGESGEIAKFKGKGEVNGKATVSARLTLACYNLQDRNPDLGETDARILSELRRHYAFLIGSADGFGLPN